MFFLNIKYPIFPLLWNAIRFYNYPELMVCNKSRSIVLHLLKGIYFFYKYIIS